MRQAVCVAINSKVVYLKCLLSKSVVATTVLRNTNLCCSVALSTTMQLIWCCKAVDCKTCWFFFWFHCLLIWNTFDWYRTDWISNLVWITFHSFNWSVCLSFPASFLFCSFFFFFSFLFFFYFVLVCLFRLLCSVFFLSWRKISAVSCRNCFKIFYVGLATERNWFQSRWNSFFSVWMISTVSQYHRDTRKQDEP